LLFVVLLAINGALLRFGSDAIAVGGGFDSEGEWFWVSPADFELWIHFSFA
jgi:hypothetical protein